MHSRNSNDLIRYPKISSNFSCVRTCVDVVVEKQEIVPGKLILREYGGFLRIDDDYDDGDQRASTCNSILPIVTTGRNMLFGGGPSHSESAPLISGSSTPGDVYNPPPSTHVVGSSRNDEVNPVPPAMASSSRRNNHRWDHIENLDRFFTLVYEYHQGGGFLTIAVKKIFGLAQFVFIVTFSTFFMQCVDYDVLFANKNVTATGVAVTGKRSFNDAIVENCASHLHPLVVFSILVAIIFWISRVVKTTYYLLQLHEIQLFYHSALLIEDAQLSNLTWHSVVKRICEVQKRLQLIVDRDNVTPIDLYNRILRFKNYLVALVNTRVLPPVFNVPFIGPVPYLPNGLKSNIRRILFFGSTSPWAGPYLKEEYKDLDNLESLTRQMEKDVAMYGFLNLIFFPLIFLYQILYSFFTLSELIRRRPDALGMRRYSNYGRYRVRHFNELNHELTARLNRSHVYANAYLNQFYSTLTEVFAKNIAFVAGAIAGVLAILSAWDEDVLQVGSQSYVSSHFSFQLERDVSSAVHPGCLGDERNLLLDSVHSLVPSVRASQFRNPLIGDGLHRVDGPLGSIGGGLLSTLHQVNPQMVDSLTRSLQQSGVDLDSAGADMRIQTLFLRGMHEESLRRSSATATTGYGASVAINPAQSIFGVPQLSQMDESVMPESDARSRLTLRSNLPGTSEEEAEEDERSQQDDDDNEPPPQFMNV
ncbi:autophagy protein Apg9 [Ancylostoma caninum]|uniref:Autophagy-related protein 9 n=1 Tax=Ancylostoma caninum TaxID=29170 RepID=A0A368G9H9_ANCCA|nr:autophagy protein Apg9 [Ancylostoma caninum]